MGFHLPKRRVLVYVSVLVFWCRPLRMTSHVTGTFHSYTTRWQYIHKQGRTLRLLAGRKWDAIPQAWNQLSCHFPLLLCLLYFSLSYLPPTNNSTACPILIVMHHRENIMKYTPAIKFKFDWLDRKKMLSTVLCSHAPSAPLCSRLLFSELNAERDFLINNVGVKLLSVSLPLW